MSESNVLQTINPFFMFEFQLSWFLFSVPQQCLRSHHITARFYGQLNSSFDISLRLITCLLLFRSHTLFHSRQSPIYGRPLTFIVQFRLSVLISNQENILCQKSLTQPNVTHAQTHITRHYCESYVIYFKDLRLQLIVLITKDTCYDLIFRG